MPEIRPLALVTGASSGIGRAFALRLATEGYDIIAVGRQQDRLDALSDAVPEANFLSVVADLASDDGVRVVAEICALEPLSLLVNNAGVAHYMGFLDLPADKAEELVHVKVVAPTLLTQAAAKGMVARGEGTIINVAGMLGFSGPVPQSTLPLKRATYTGSLAHLIGFSQALHEELKDQGIRVQALCPGVVATEFHERQGLDLSAVPRMTAEEVVTASLKGLTMGETVCAPGLEQADLLHAVTVADLAAFAGQSPELASRYRA